MSNRLNRREMDAILEALAFRTAGVIETYGDPDHPEPQDYDDAYGKISAQMRRLKGRQAARGRVISS